MFDGIDNAYPLTPLQKGILYEVLKHPESDIYVAYLCIDIYGPQLDDEILKQAWHETMLTKDCLRTRFIWEGLDDPLQVVDSNIELSWHVIDLQSDLPESKSELIFLHLNADKSRRLSISEQPANHFTLLKFAPDNFVLIWTVHHLLADDWSTPVVLQSVADAYSRLSEITDRGTSVGFTPKEDSLVDSKQSPEGFKYVDYVDWLSSVDMSVHARFWQSALAGIEATPLQLDSHAVSSQIRLNPRDNEQSWQRRQEHFFSNEYSSRIIDYCKNNALTLSSFLHGAWSLVLARYASTHKPVFGTSVSGRSCPLENIDTAVGLFLNTLPTVIEIDESETVIHFLKRIQLQLFEQISHEHLPLPDIQKFMRLTDHEPSFESVLVVEAHNSEIRIASVDSSIEFTNITYTTDSNYPLTLLVFPGKSIQLALIRTTHLISKSAHKAIMLELVEVIDDLVNPALPIVGDICGKQRIRSSRIQESRFLPAGWSNHSASSSMASWLETVLHEHVDKTAIISKGSKHSYGDLYQQSERIRSSIIREHDSNKSFVAILAQPGFEQMASMVAILRAGNAYVPLDAVWPPDRLIKALMNGRVGSVIVDQYGAEKLRDHKIKLPFKVINLETVLNEVLDSSNALNTNENVSGTPVNSEGPAYMIYTSGSTGKSKEVVVSQQNLMYSTRARIDFYQDNPDTYLLLSALSFDSSVAGIFWTLCTGAVLVIASEAEKRDIDKIDYLINEYQVTHMLCLPTLYRHMLRSGNLGNLSAMRLVIVAGEPCSKTVIEQHQKNLNNCRLFNEYGPTEATVWASVARLDELNLNDTDHVVPIGQAVPGSRIYIVDTNGRVCPDEVKGELVICGPGVTSGSHQVNRVVHTGTSTERNWSQADESEALQTYWTGDCARYGSDGQLYYLGRTDKQVKIRGFRIDTTEIEELVEQQQHVSRACCIKHTSTDEQGSAGEVERLICFYSLTTALQENSMLHQASTDIHPVTDKALTKRIAEINKHTASAIDTFLPKQFKVHSFVCVNRMPTLPNGKINPEELVRLYDVIGSKLERPLDMAAKRENGRSATLGRLIASLLNVESVRDSDNFFGLGGDSMTAIRLVAAARETGINLSIPMLDEHANFGSLFRSIDEQYSDDDSISQLSASGKTPLSPIQRWFLSVQNTDPAHWNMACVLRIPAPVETSMLRGIVEELVKENPVLNACFSLQDGVNEQWIPDTPDTESLCQLVNSPVDLNDIKEKLFIVQKEFDLRSGRLIGFLLIENSPGMCDQLAWVAHHLVTDVISNWLIAMKTVVRCQNQTESLESGVSNFDTNSYRNWCFSLADRESSRKRSSESDTADVSGAPALSTSNDDKKTNMNDTMLHPNQSPYNEFNTSSEELVVDATQWGELAEICRSLDIELAPAVLFLLVCSLKQLMELEQEISVDVESHGRNPGRTSCDVTSSLGWFTDFFRLHTKTSGAILDNQQLLAFVAQYDISRNDQIDGFSCNPETYFLQPEDHLPFNRFLYNYLVVDNSVAHGESDIKQPAVLRDELFELIHLFDSELRNQESLRTHAIDLSVLKRDSHVLVRFNYDRNCVDKNEILSWMDQLRINLKKLVTESKDDIKFIDSGMDSDELDEFLSNLI